MTILQVIDSKTTDTEIYPQRHFSSLDFRKKKKHPLNNLNLKTKEKQKQRRKKGSKYRNLT